MLLDLLNEARRSRKPLLAPGVFDGLSARAAARAGFQALYLSGFCVAGTRLGQPDIGLVTATEMAETAARIVDAGGGLPLIADADNGYGGPMNVARTVRDYARAGVAGIQLEDQVHPKKCGHMENKAIVPLAEATLRIRVARDTTADVAIVARTDAIATDGLDEALRRADAFLAAGADVLFIEAPTSTDELETIATRFVGVPLVANLVEDGKTPLPAIDVLGELGFALVLRPVSALLRVTETLRAVYRELAQGGAPDPDAQRVRFDEFNRLAGLDEIDAYVDQLSGAQE
ncbi:MAG: carboxyvinyl-carboxyphosphonate phosphorylmutase [Gammaproteobacteria bacterium]|nr:carboxyvinyl-carboxyphosphonate phosphorylmutase [Gammaproteobacteria bacterium]